MNFIIPKNYKFKPKLLGLIDYPSAILCSIWAVILYALVNILFTSLSIKVYFFLGLFVPVILFCIVGINNENVISVIFYILKYFIKQKVYLYKKRNL